LILALAFVIASGYASARIHHEPRTSCYTVSDAASAAEPVGTSRRRIVAHPAADRSRHAA
jgi:predicted urease superfamily metal-dependent hydrolase